VSSRREVFSRAELTADLSVRKLSPAANEVRPVRNLRPANTIQFRLQRFNAA
jgi:hypothetical protein